MVLFQPMKCNVLGLGILNYIQLTLRIGGHYRECGSLYYSSLNL